MKNNKLILIISFCFFFIFGAVHSSFAQGEALLKLLEIFESRGMITQDEAEIMKQMIGEEQKDLLTREKDLKEREEALAEKERELIQREERLSKNESITYKEAKEKGEGRLLEASYDEGFYLTDQEQDDFSLYIGGLLQTDYRHLGYDLPKGSIDPPKDKFDLRRIRLRFGGSLLQRFDYKLELEYEGVGSGSNLLDAYVDTHINPAVSLRVGQFREPFGLEQSSKDKDLFFAERSMGYHLIPHWDLGIMMQVSSWDERLHANFGLFNGDGRDNAVGGDEDSPELTARMFIEPLKDSDISFGENIQLGASFGYARIDNNNVNIHVKTTGLTEFLDVAANAKFNIIRYADTRKRFGADIAFTHGPMAIMGEGVRVKYSGIGTSTDLFDTELQDLYLSFLYMVTGERPAFINGALQPIRPYRSFWDGGWGALGLAFRYDTFEADDQVYENLVERGYSIRSADSYTLASNWYLNPFTRFTLDATRTTFDSGLLVYRDSLTGTAIYSDREYVYTGRFQVKF